MMLAIWAPVLGLLGGIVVLMLVRPMWVFRRVLGPMVLRSQGLRRMTVDVPDGRRWPVVVGGPAHGPSTVVLLHGFGVDGYSMMLSARVLLKAGHRVVVPDLPGFGEHAFDHTAVHDERFMIDGLEGLAEVLGITRCSVVGSSMGGALCAAWAHTHPDRISRAVLLDPAGVEPPVVNAVYAAVDRDEHPFDIRTIADFDRILDMNFQRVPKIPWFVKRDIVREARGKADQGEVIIRALEPLLRDGLSHRLPTLHQPVLLVWGKDDRVIDPSAMPIWRDALPDGTVLELDDCGHVPWSDRPDAVLPALKGFLAGQLEAS